MTGSEQKMEYILNEICQARNYNLRRETPCIGLYRLIYARYRTTRHNICVLLAHFLHMISNKQFIITACTQGVK